MDEINLFNIYDMRSTYQNGTSVKEQVETWKNRSSLLMWYTADEPDGWSYPLNSTKIVYDQLKELDPYHPVSLVLNCHDFYYKDYSSGADIVFEDAYPIAINATWSNKFGVPCNTTYGDCGCDDCIGELSDVSTRLDDIQLYQTNLNGQGSKPTWSVLQAFGAQDYWQSIPSAAEVENMMMLSVNHNAKGLTYWLYPSTDAVNAGSGNLGRVFQTAPARDFLLGANAIKGLPVEGISGSNIGAVDASAWILGEQIMIGIAIGAYVDSDALVSITLPVEVSIIDKVLYGEPGWKADGNKLSKAGLNGLGVDIMVLNISLSSDQELARYIFEMVN
jgi:hypothetical protein